jgi:hypothetical protein
MTKRKEYDTTFPNMVHKTKYKNYVPVCPACKHPGPVFRFRIEATNWLRGHLKTKHDMTEDQARQIQVAINTELNNKNSPWYREPLDEF